MYSKLLRWLLINILIYLKISVTFSIYNKNFLIDNYEFNLKNMNYLNEGKFLKQYQKLKLIEANSTKKINLYKSNFIQKKVKNYAKNLSKLNLNQVNKSNIRKLFIKNTEQFKFKKINELSDNISSILEDLLKGYDKNERPHLKDGKTIITANLHIRSMGPMSEKFMEYSLDCYFRQRWYDSRLKYEGSFKSLTLNIHMLERIWKPDTFFLNGKGSYLHEITRPNKFLRIHQGGEVYYSMRLTIKARCLMELSNFPMDKQSCPLMFGSYAYQNNELIYVWDPRGSVSLTNDMVMSQFDLISYPSRNGTRKFRKGQYSIVQVNFNFIRHTGYFLIQIYFPCSLIVVLSWVGFWINREATSDRVGLGVTSVLTLATFGLETRTDFPKVSYPTALDWFVIMCFVFVNSTLIQFAGVHYFTKVGSGELPFYNQQILNKEKNSLDRNKKSKFVKQDNIPLKKLCKDINLNFLDNNLELDEETFDNDEDRKIQLQMLNIKKDINTILCAKHQEKILNNYLLKHNNLFESRNTNQTKNETLNYSKSRSKSMDSSNFLNNSTYCYKHKCWSNKSLNEHNLNIVQDKDIVFNAGLPKSQVLNKAKTKTKTYNQHLNLDSNLVKPINELNLEQIKNEEQLYFQLTAKDIQKNLNEKLIKTLNLKKYLDKRTLIKLQKIIKKKRLNRIYWFQRFRAPKLLLQCISCLIGSDEYRDYILRYIDENEHVNSVSKIDELSKILFPLSFVLLNLIYWLYYFTERNSTFQINSNEAYVLEIV